MQVEFIEPEEAAGSEDVIVAGRGRRHPRLVNAGLAALLVAGGIGWIAGRPDTMPAAAPTPSPRTHAGAPLYGNDALAGCPDTLACDANHQVQQHMIDLIREKMREHARAVRAGHPATRTPVSHLGNVGRNYVVD